MSSSKTVEIPLSSRKSHGVQKMYSVIETLKSQYADNQSWDETQSTLCLVCQNQVKLTQPLATCSCACRMVCHRSCLKDYYEETSSCPVCNQKQKMICDTLSIWTNPKKINDPLKLKTFSPSEEMLHNINSTKFEQKFEESGGYAEDLLSKIYKSLCEKIIAEFDQPLPALIQLNQEMYKYNRVYQYLVFPIELIKPPGSFFEYKPINLGTLNSFYKILKTFNGLSLFKNKNKKYAIFPHYQTQLNQLLQIDEKFNLKEVFNQQGLSLSGPLIDRVLTSSKSPQRPDLTIYLTGKNQEQRSMSLQYLLSFFNDKGTAFDLLIYRNILNFYINQRLIQVIITDEKNPVEVIKNFDYTHSQFYYQKEQIYGTYDGLTAIKTRTTRYSKSPRPYHQIDLSKLLNVRQLGYNVLLPLNSQMLVTTFLKPKELLQYPEHKKHIRYYCKDSHKSLPIEEIDNYIDTLNTYPRTTCLSIDNQSFNLNWQTVPQLIELTKNTPNSHIENLPTGDNDDDEEELEMVDYDLSDDEDALYQNVAVVASVPPVPPLNLPIHNWETNTRYVDRDDRIEQDPRDFPPRPSRHVNYDLD